MPKRRFNGDGYYIGLDESKIVLTGANAHSTYYAVSHFINEYLKGDPDLITNACDDGCCERYDVTRESYINDISKLPVVWQYEWSPITRFLDFEEKISSFNTVTDGRAMAIAHRGDMECYPENSVEGIISATRKGADAIEIDVCRTKDGIFVLNHGLSLNPNTDWSLKAGQIVNGIQLPSSAYVFDWTLEELRQLNLRFGNGEYCNSASEITDYKIATLEEVFKVIRNRTLVIVDQVNKTLETEERTDFNSAQRGVNNPYWADIYALAKATGAYRCFTGSAFASNLAEANTIVNAIQNEFSVTCANQFLRTGSHNAIIDWYAEFGLTTDEEFGELYSSYITTGIIREGVPSKGDFIMSNRLTKLLEWINRTYD